MTHVCSRGWRFFWLRYRWLWSTSRGSFRSTSLPLSHKKPTRFEIVRRWLSAIQDNNFSRWPPNIPERSWSTWKVGEWLGMRFNAKKCYLMSFNCRYRHFYTLNNQILQKIKQNPYFGILISEDLKWEPHLTKITQKANSILAFLKRNLRHCPEPCRRTAYISLVRSRSFWVNNLLRVLKSVTWLDALAKRMSWEIYTPKSDAGDIGTLIFQCLSENNDSHELQQGSFVFYRGW